LLCHTSVRARGRARLRLRAYVRKPCCMPRVLTRFPCRSSRDVMLQRGQGAGRCRSGRHREATVRVAPIRLPPPPAIHTCCTHPLFCTPSRPSAVAVIRARACALFERCMSSVASHTAAMCECVCAHISNTPSVSHNCHAIPCVRARHLSYAARLPWPPTRAMQTDAAARVSHLRAESK
jgi:hypothetical protein